MTVEKKTNVDWRSDELDAIVADYFEMLSADISGRKYVKSKHNAALNVPPRTYPWIN